MKTNYPVQARAAENRKAALDMVRAGKSYDEIVATGLYASRGAVSVAVRAGLEMSRKEMFTSAELYRAQSLDRLNALLGACWDRAIAGSKDHIAEARRIISDIGDLTGAKAPVRYEIGEGDVDRLLAALDARLEQLEPDRPEAIEAEAWIGEEENQPAGAPDQG